jgi:hypothetical protein
MLPGSSRNRSKFVVFQIGNRAHGFMILSVFAAHFTDDLNLRNLVYSILHVCYKKIKQANNNVCSLFRRLLTSKTFHKLYMKFPRWCNSFIRW